MTTQKVKQRRRRIAVWVAVIAILSLLFVTMGPVSQASANPVPVPTNRSQPEVPPADTSEQERVEWGVDDYPEPWRSAPQDSMIDDWGQYNRECTSFVAFRLSDRNDFEIAWAYGFATEWKSHALADGVTVNSTPAKGAVAWFSYGHVAWVESVNGTSVNIEEYNYGSPGNYNHRTISKNEAEYIHFKDIKSGGGGVSPSTGADFDGDGNDDVLWYAPGSGKDTLWFGTTTRRDFDAKSISVTGTYRPFTGDFDGDGKSDIVWYAPGDASDRIWFGTTTRGSFAAHAVNIVGDYVPLSGDFDGDGKSDILFYGAGSKPDRLWYGTGRGTFDDRDVTVTGTYRPFVGDFDGDGRDDVFWFGPGSAKDTLWYGTSTRGDFAGESITVKGTYLPFAGDFDADGKSDVFWYGPGSGFDSMWFGTSTQGTFMTGYDITVKGTYIPVVGDFNGADSGRTDVIWYGAGAKHDALWYASTTRGDFDGYDITVKGTYIPVF